jgi:hypothetical protein
MTRHSLPEPEERSETATSTALGAWEPPAWLTTPSNDPARALVVDVLRALAENGEVEWTILESGDVCVTHSSGLVLHLRENGITRIR